MKRRGGWRLVEDGRLPEVMKLHAAGKSTRAIATALDMGQSAVSRLIRKANQNGLAALNAKAGAESESVSPYIYLTHHPEPSPLKIGVWFGAGWEVLSHVTRPFFR
jgi:hypothetical protein